MVKLPICDITPFTLQDFPGNMAGILWFAGCNLRCQYCHNPPLVLCKIATLHLDAIVQFLESRQGLLDGVVLSGGECTLSKDLPFLVTLLRRLGYKIKLDTNGIKPEVLKDLLREQMLDYVALDFKATKEKFFHITGRDYFEKFQESLDLLCGFGVPLEVRTTVHTDLLDVCDINAMIQLLVASNFRGDYYIQNFRMSNTTLGQLPEQKFLLDISAITSPPQFNVRFRNF